MPETLINWRLIKNPVNWVIVFLMIFIAGIAVDLLATWISETTPTS